MMKNDEESMISVASVAYLAGLVCLYAWLSAWLGVKGTLLIFGAVHIGCALLLLVVCWREMKPPLPAGMEHLDAAAAPKGSHVPATPPPRRRSFVARWGVRARWEQGPFKVPRVLPF